MEDAPVLEDREPLVHREERLRDEGRRKRAHRELPVVLRYQGRRAREPPRVVKQPVTVPVGSIVLVVETLDVSFTATLLGAGCSGSKTPVTYVNIVSPSVTQGP